MRAAHARTAMVASRPAALVRHRGSATAGICTLILAVLAGAAHATPHSPLYTLDFPAPPRSGQEALDTFNTRATVVIRAHACGREEEFLTALNRPNKIKEVVANEDSLGIAIAKAAHYIRTDAPCNLPDNLGDREVDVARKIDREFPNCIVVDRVDDQNRYGLRQGCLRRQINELLKRSEVVGTIGSTGLPCLPGTQLTEGEWHIAIRDLTRIYYMNERAGRTILEENVRLKVRDSLLTLSGPPSDESYSVFECGNQERATGTPDELVDEDTWLSSALDDIGDALEWLAKWLVLLGAVLLAAGAVAAIPGIGPALAGAVVTLGVLGAIAVAFGRIPETENHLLMIQADRYLKNQIILDEMSSGHPNRGRYVDHQAAVREWLLRRFQRIVREDFVEYNARPYQRYSLAAARMLYDFGKDQQLRLAAQSVLDLATAKMAIGSNGGRRLVPYRRLMENLPPLIEGPLKNGLFDLSGGADHQIAAMLVYIGQTQHGPLPGKVSWTATGDMILAVVSDYRPPLPVLDLAVDKPVPYLQRIRHAAFEIYSSAPGFLITAGGIPSGPSSTIELTGFAPGGASVGIAAASRNTDRGAAVPTTVMITGGKGVTFLGRSSLEAFLRINGVRRALDSDNATYDHNLCVADGFACGLNIQKPGDMGGCFELGPPGSPSKWSFFDTDACPPYREARRVMIAMYQEDCTGDQTGECIDDIGVLEAVSEPSVDFDTFKRCVIQNNPSASGWSRLVPAAPGTSRKILSGTYTTFAWTNGSCAARNQIAFVTAGNQLNPQRTGIDSINGVAVPDLSAWPRAQGVLSGDDRTIKFEFVHPGTGQGFRVDMSDWQNPVRQDF